MFDLAWSEIAVIGVVAVLVLGPKELPAAMRTMAKVMRKMRSLSSELQGHINEVVREAELEEVRQSIQKLSTTNITAEVTKAVDPTGELSAELNPNTMSATPAAQETAAAETAPASENAAPSSTTPPASSSSSAQSS
jgi:sec-independent protein translocase protein TatB